MLLPVSEKIPVLILIAWAHRLLCRVVCTLIVVVPQTVPLHWMNGPISCLISYWQRYRTEALNRHIKKKNMKVEATTWKSKVRYIYIVASTFGLPYYRFSSLAKKIVCRFSGLSYIVFKNVACQFVIFKSNQCRLWTLGIRGAMTAEIVGW